jgi:hypothetical protein
MFSNFVPSRRTLIFKGAKVICRRQTTIRPAPPTSATALKKNEAMQAMLKSQPVIFKTCRDNDDAKIKFYDNGII